MTLNLTMPGQEDLKPRITVFGVGGAGGNAVNNMIDKDLDGVEFVVANTDAQALQQSKAVSRVQMGVKVTEGLGAGARPSVGAAAAEETIEEIVDHLAGAHMCFITAGMGGGTGTGAAPIIAQAARELGVLTVGVVTKPFLFEGAKRMKQAEEGIEALQKMVDTLIIIPNQNLFRLANEKTTFTEAFSLADDVLYQGVKGVTDLMVKPGLINLDFADVRAVMDEMGKAMMGTGESDGEDRAVQAAEKAIANPLLDEISLRGARGVLINITGGYDLTLFELDEAANRIREEVDPEANIIVGSTLDTDMEGSMRVSVVATGIDASEIVQDVPVPRRRLAQPLNAPQSISETLEEVAPAAEIAATSTAAPLASRHGYTPAAEPQVAGLDLFEADQSVTAATNAAAAEQLENVFPADEAGQDLPPPAYLAEQPTASQAEMTHVAYDDTYDDAGGVTQFVAPKAPAPGTPSNDAMARLQAAVQRQPGPAVPTRAEQTSKFAKPSPEPEKSRFGINSLINRMTGHGSNETMAESERQQPPIQVQPADPMPETDQQKTDIPAFLRRQAN